MGLQKTGALAFLILMFSPAGKDLFALLPAPSFGSFSFFLKTFFQLSGGSLLDFNEVLEEQGEEQVSVGLESWMHAKSICSELEAAIFQTGPA